MSMFAPWVKEANLEGPEADSPAEARQTAANGLRWAIMRILVVRFDIKLRVAKPIEAKLDKTDDLSQLRRWVVEVAAVESPEAFAAKIQA
jgi:hypothetical protein